jgi:hypothetical protein
LPAPAEQGAVGPPAKTGGSALAERAGSRAKRLLLSTPLLGALIAAITWPFKSIAPSAGLDPSWIAGLYMAAERGMHAGTQIIFTYGPLGFLGLPELYNVWLGRFAFIWSALVQVVFCVSLLWASRRAFGLAAGLAIAVCATMTPIADPLAIAAVVVGAAALLGDWSLRARLALGLGLGTLAGMQLLGSLRTGPALAAVGVAVLLGLPDRRRTFPAFIGSLVLSFAVFWFATGQGIGNLDEYAVNTVNVVGGYSEAMVFVLPGPGWRAPAVLLAATTLGVLCLAAVWRRDNPRRAGLVLLVAAVAFLMFKHAFVRESPASVGAMFASFLAIGVALVPHVRRRLAIGSVAVLIALAFVANPDLGDFPLQFGRNAKAFAGQVRTIAIPGRAAEEEQRGREGMEAAYALGPADLALLRQGTVHVAPWEAGAAWAYGLDWDPLPAFQQYEAYTERLDNLNAAKLESASAPDLILWQNTTTFDPAAVNFPGAIDARWPAFESPAEMVQMFCRYRVARWSVGWAILRRSPDRCGPERALKTVAAKSGEVVPLPRARANEAVLVRVDDLAVSGVERLRSLLFRAKNRRVIFGGNAWNIVGDTAGDGLLLQIPHWADYPGRFALDSESPTVAFERMGGLLTGAGNEAKLTLSFSALPLTAPALLPRALALQKRRVQR